MSAKFIHPPSESLMLKGPAEKAPSFEGARVINLLSKSGAEGQSRTDTRIIDFLTTS
jgi:hypothetical protein